jgi:hypothetical protein
MTRLLFSIFILIPLLAFGLDPATITMTNMRAEEVSSASDADFYRSETIHFTNCIALSGTTTSSTPQDLTGLAILLTVGDSVVTSATVTGAVTTATSGVWNASVTLRSNEGAKTFIQLRLTNSATMFTYPFKYINVKSKL